MIPNFSLISNASEMLLTLVKETQNVRPRSTCSGDAANDNMIHEGGRNQHLFSLAAGFYHKGLASEALREAVMAVNRHQCKPPLEDDEIENILKNVQQYVREGGMRFDQTDVGNADQFIESKKLTIKHCFSLKIWLFWDGRRWVIDEVKGIIRHIVEWLQMLDSVPPLVDSGNDKARKEYNEFKKHLRKSRTKSKIEAIEWLSRSHLQCAMKGDLWNLDSNLLNMQNGTFHLDRYVLQPHNKTDHITNILDYSYDATAECPQFRAFLNKILQGDKHMICFIQKLMGYILTGKPVQQQAYIFFGSGANGKTTLIEVILLLLGSYGCSAQFSTFLHRSQERIRNDLARFAGKRFITAPETGGTDHLDESLLKQITGGDTISARFLYGELFDYKPQFVLAFTANHLPHIQGVDEGIWRRIILIPFEIQIPESERDRLLLNKLRTELSGIFNFAIEGLKLYRQDGLKIPDAIQQATANYRSDANKVVEFINERCVVGKVDGKVDGKVACPEFHNAYYDWCKQMKYPKLARNDIAVVMERNGHIKKRINGINYYAGLELGLQAI